MNAQEEIEQLRADRDHFDQQHRVMLMEKNAMQAERDQLKQQLAHAQREIAGYQEQRDSNLHTQEKLTAQLAQAQAACALLEAQCAVMRDTLEWCYSASHWMGKSQRIKDALAPNAGKDPLDRLERYEKALKDIASYGNDYAREIAREALKGEQK